MFEKEDSQRTISVKFNSEKTFLRKSHKKPTVVVSINKQCLRIIFLR